MGTLAFMAMSGLIMDLLKRLNKDRSNSVFWFLCPVQSKSKSDDDQNNSCEHEETCTKYILEGVTSYAVVGMIFEFVKYGFFHAGQLRNDPVGFLYGLVKKINSPLVRFLTFSAGIYRVRDLLTPLLK